MALEQLAERLRTARAERGLSQEQMAEAVGVSKATWQSYEYGKTVAGADVLLMLLELGFAAEWLLTGDGPMWCKDAAVAVDGTVVDLGLLHDCTRALEEMLEEKGARLAPEKKAKALVLIYEYFTKIGKIDREQMARIIDLAA